MKTVKEVSDVIENLKDAFTDKIDLKMVTFDDRQRKYEETIVILTQKLKKDNELS